MQIEVRFVIEMTFAHERNVICSTGIHFPPQKIRTYCDEPHAKKLMEQGQKNYFLGLTVVSFMWFTRILPHHQSTTAPTPIQYMQIIQAKSPKM
jgi:hypothetical protein